MELSHTVMEMLNDINLSGNLSVFIVVYILILQPYSPELGIYQREIKNFSSHKNCTGMFIAAIFIIINNWKQPQSPSTAEWINKQTTDSYNNMEEFQRHYVKEASLREASLKDYIFWFHLYDILENTPVIVMENNECLPWDSRRICNRAFGVMKFSLTVVVVTWITHVTIHRTVH